MFFISNGQMETLFFLGLLGDMCLLYLAVLAFSEPGVLVSSLVPFGRPFARRLSVRGLVWVGRIAGSLLTISMTLLSVALGIFSVFLMTDRLVSLNRLEQLEIWLERLFPIR